MTKKTASTNPIARLTVAMEVGMGNPNAETDALDALLADLGQPTGVSEILESASSDEILEDVIGVLELESAEPSQDVAPESDEVIEPTTAEKPKKLKVKATDEEKAAKKAVQDAARAAAREKRAVERKEKAEKRAVEKAAKPAPVPRKHYASIEERVIDVLGDKLGDYTTLELQDVELLGDELLAKQRETIDAMNQCGIKVQNRIQLMMMFMSGRSNKLNEVIHRAFVVLKNDGKITSGDKGNLHLNLLSKPYSPSAARAMGNNTIAALRTLKVVIKGEKGEYLPNPSSLVLMKISSMIESV